MDAVAIRDVAGRLRSLVESDQTTAGLADASDRLAVSERDLSDVLGRRGAWPSLESLAAVCAAAVRCYGVDPAWLVTGDCDPALHRLADELSVDQRRLCGLLTDLFRRGVVGNPRLA